MSATLTHFSRRAVCRFRKRPKLVLETRLFLVALVVYTSAFLLTVPRGAVSRASVVAPLAPAPVIAKPIVAAPKTAPTPWDENIHARPARGKFKRFYRMTATAYRPIHKGIEGGRWTKTQRDGRSAHGVAVDPDMIPLGSRLWIPGYGHAIADDTGGWIKGHRIDIRCQNEDSMDDWGRRKLRVYVLQEPTDTFD